ncbi:MAG TPA: hypothetical protein VHH88_09230 [Verrucomicrobiae bacterium]|nr:hypothetical protein [Verrucomicrobiae bacterium]
MDFLKKHYEKVLLGIVLIGLLGAFASLPIKINSEKQKLEDLANSLTHPKVLPLTNLDLTTAENTLKRMGTPVSLDFTSTNRLFNPMTWQMGRDNRLIRLDKAGPVAAVVTNIEPLYLVLSLDSVNISSDGTANYAVGIEQQAAPVPRHRRHHGVLVSLNDRHKNDIFTLTGVNGPADNPTSLTLVLNDTGETVKISKDKPFKRIDGYMATIAYEPEKKVWRDRRIGDLLVFNGEDYNIVAITQNEVVLSARSNQKKWTLKLSSATSPNSASVPR